MLHLLQRHPFAVTAFFRRALVLTYAFPRDILQPLLPPGLVLDTCGNFGFLAIAMMQTERLRPSFIPAAWGRSFFLSGYRIFTRLGEQGSSLRGLYILRSDTDRRVMVHLGNLFTHYRYSLCCADLTEGRDGTTWQVRTPNGDADLEVLVPHQTGPAPMPVRSPFSSAQHARKYAGPLPYTFNYERQTNSIIRVFGVRKEWKPQPVSVEVRRNVALENKPFDGAAPLLASAFALHHVPYHWQPGTRVALGPR